MSSQQSVVVIDYGTSNLRSVAKALEHVAANRTRITVTGNPADIRNADRIVFPGQGAIGQCMQHLTEQGLDDCIHECISDNKPFLGICLGLQSLMQFSDEDGGTDCLGIFAGKVTRFVLDDTARLNACKIPHMGWNQVRQRQAHPLWDGIDDGSRFYFVHSYYVVPDDEAIIAGATEYIHEFTSAVARDNIFACQFHPEKSQHDGLKLLQNFLDWDIQDTREDQA